MYSVVGLFLEATTPFSVNTPDLLVASHPIDVDLITEEFSIYFYDPCSACWPWMAWVPTVYLVSRDLASRMMDIFDTACPVVVASIARFYSSIQTT
jgi:hypothetical protein